MEIQSSYIFLPNHYNKKEKQSSEKPVQIEEQNIKLTIKPSVIGYLTEAFPQLSANRTRRDLTTKEYSFSIDEDNTVYQVRFLAFEVEDATYLNVYVSSGGRSKNKIIRQLEHIQDTILNSELKNDYIDIISYDAISEHYCNKILPKLNKLERNLRHLLFNIYILNFDTDYYKSPYDNSSERTELRNNVYQRLGSNLQTDRKAEIKKRYNVSSDDVKVINRIQRFFYSFDYGDLEKFLFSKNWTEYDQKAKENFLSGNKDLQALSDSELRNAIESFSPKSDWERFFSSKIDMPNIYMVFQQIHAFRNSAAHFKFFNRDDYEECNQKTNKLNYAIQKAILITEEEDFHQKNREALNKAFDNIIDTLSSVVESFQKSMKSVVDSIIPQISAVTDSLTKSLSFKWENIMNDDANNESDAHTRLIDEDGQYDDNEPNSKQND